MTWRPRTRRCSPSGIAWQSELDAWHRANPGPVRDMAALPRIPRIDRLSDAGSQDVKISTTNVDDELAVQAGPQLVVPVIERAYALNAANARWGLLCRCALWHRCDQRCRRCRPWQGLQLRGQKVIAFGRSVLDQAAPVCRSLACGDAISYAVSDGALRVSPGDGPDWPTGPVSSVSGRRRRAECGPVAGNNGLHIEIQIDRSGRRWVGRRGVNDLLVEAALSNSIMDCEDPSRRSMPTTQGGRLSQLAGPDAGFAGRRVREGQQDRHPPPERRPRIHWQRRQAVVLHGRARCSCATGHLMTNPAILDGGQKTLEGILDAVVTTLISLPRPEAQGQFRRQHLCRQAEDARSGGGCLCRRTVRSGRELLELPLPPSSSASWTKSAVPA